MGLSNLRLLVETSGMCKLALGHPKQTAQTVQDTKPSGQAGSDRAPRGWQMGSNYQVKSQSTASGDQAEGAPQGGTNHKPECCQYKMICTSLKLQQFVYTVPDRVFSNVSRNGAFGSTMSRVVCCRKMKGEPASIKSGSARKHSMIHFHISVNMTLFQGFPVIINHKI